MSMSNPQEHGMFSWRYKGGPKNNGRFSYFEGWKFRTGLNHRPMTKLARTRFLRRDCR